MKRPAEDERATSSKRRLVSAAASSTADLATKVVEGLDMCKRGIAYVWLHYVYEPIWYRRRVNDASSYVMRNVLSPSTIALEEAIHSAQAEPFRARLPASARGFVEPTVEDQRPAPEELQRTMPARRYALRLGIEDWRSCLVGRSELFSLSRLTPKTSRRHYFSRVPLQVSRDDVFNSAATGFLAATAPHLLSGVHVQFVASDSSVEIGVDSGGLTREFFDMALRELVGDGRLPRSASATVASSQAALPSPMFRQQADSALMVVASTRPPAMYYALGRFLATALVHASYGDLALPFVLNDCLLKYLVGQPLTAVDVRRRDPVYYKNRIGVLQAPGAIEEMASILGVDKLVFAEDNEELVPGGAEIAVTPKNVDQYIARLSEHYICGSVRSELAQLTAGFHGIIPEDLLQRCGITFADLGMLLSGVPQVDVREWKAHARVHAAGVPGKVAERLASWFWELMASWPQEERTAVLAFTTGCSRLPAMGFAALDPAFTLEVVPNRGSPLPSAHTCVYTLTLPAYDSASDLAAKLSVAVREGIGTGFDLR